MRKLLLALALLFISDVAFAQCNGVFGANTVCGSIAGGAPGPVPFINFPSGLVVGTTTIGNGTPNGLLYDAAGVLGNLATGNNGVLVTNGSGVPSIGNTLLGDFYFGSGRPWCDIRAEGAKQDGTTDDYAAWQMCNTIQTMVGGGIIYVPPSTSPSCIKSTTFAPGNGVVIVGVSNGYGENTVNNPPSMISACGTDHTLLNFVNVANGMRGMFVKGADFGTQPAVTVSAARLLLEDNTFRGGAPPVKIVAGAAQVDNVYNFNRFGASYGTANILIQNIAFYGYRNIFNTAYQGNAPATGSISTISAWAATAGLCGGQHRLGDGPRQQDLLHQGHPDRRLERVVGVRPRRSPAMIRPSRTAQ